ncbi:MAG: hypothetical protein ABIH88_02125 [Patescibacteria group bacterium]
MKSRQRRVKIDDDVVQKTWSRETLIDILNILIPNMQILLDHMKDLNSDYVARKRPTLDGMVKLREVLQKYQGGAKVAIYIDPSPPHRSNVVLELFSESFVLFSLEEGLLEVRTSADFACLMRERVERAKLEEMKKG